MIFNIYMTTTLDLSKFIYCRNCGMRTQHYRDLKHSWGYSCRICQTWQHESQLLDTQQGYAAKMILASIKDGEIYFCDGTLAEFIEAAEALEMDYDYEKSADGYDFSAWYLDNDEKAAKLKLPL
jgi:hypothetical protein